MRTHRVTGKMNQCLSETWTSTHHTDRFCIFYRDAVDTKFVILLLVFPFWLPNRTRLL